jgi:phage/plasmid-like protein (TIGR03299 family)
MELPKLDAPTNYDIAEKSQETFEFLRLHVRVGFTTERGPAWWARDNFMADGTHFEGPVPQEAVDEVLGIEFAEGPVFTRTPGGDIIKDPDRKAIIAVRDEAIMNVVGKGWRLHPYLETLDGFIKQVTFDEHAGVGSAGTLQKGGIAFLQAVLPETFEIAGYGYLPYVTAVTSVNGRKKTTFLTGAKATVCDNTVNMALRGAITSVGFKHTKNSQPKVSTAREKLGIQLVQVAEGMQDVFGDLMEIDVSDKQWREFLDLHVPMPDLSGELTGPQKRSVTLRENRRDELTRLWTKDVKVAPWTGTAFGVVQAVNTYRTWEGIVRRVEGGRLERNFTSDVTGANADEDNKVIEDLAQVLGRKVTLALA